MNKLMLAVLLSMASCAKLNLKSNVKSGKGDKGNKGVNVVIIDLGGANNIATVSKHVKKTSLKERFSKK